MLMIYPDIIISYSLISLLPSLCLMHVYQCRHFISISFFCFSFLQSPLPLHINGIQSFILCSSVLPSVFILPFFSLCPLLSILVLYLEDIRFSFLDTCSLLRKLHSEPLPLFLVCPPLSASLNTVEEEYKVYVSRDKFIAVYTECV